MNSFDIQASEQQGSPGILSLTIRDLSVLHAVYMPFLENGGLFIPTAREYSLNDEVFIFLKLMEEEDKIPVAGSVVWVTPKQAQGKRAAGIGVQFKEKNNVASAKIEACLAGFEDTQAATHTL